MFDINEELKKLPRKPGVYIMRNEHGDIIYVGKANILKSRVRQYFQAPNQLLPKTRVLVSNIKTFEFIVTSSEMEALILECNLIKKNKPKYNVLLKDDKNYPYIKVTMNEAYPRIFLTRRFENDGARYFGPYTSALAVKDTISLVKNIFPVKTCKKVLPRDIGKSRPCLNYYIYQCLGPCQGKVDQNEYRSFMNDVCDFLGGSHEKVIRRLEKLMKEASDNMDFERAAIIRDKVTSLMHTAEKQVALFNSKLNQDVFGIAVSGLIGCVQVFFVRRGKLLGRERFIIQSDEYTSPEEILNSFIQQFYCSVELIPDEIIIPVELEDENLIKEWLESKRGKKINITLPQRGEKTELIKLARQNAMIGLNRELEAGRRDSARTSERLVLIKEKLNLKDIPKRIEAYDISNTGADEITGSMVVFENGLPQNKEYRHFKVKSTDGQNDYASMQEVIFRRFRHSIADSEKGIKNGKFSKMPDLILVDGGLGHVNAIRDVLEKLDSDTPVFGMIKDDKHRTRGLIGTQGEFGIKTDMNLYRFITAIQNEAHRFAIEYNKKLREKRYKSSELDCICGVGPERKKKLLKHFGSVEKIRNAEMDDLTAVAGITTAVAESIYEYFRQ